MTLLDEDSVSIRESVEDEEGVVEKGREEEEEEGRKDAT